MRALAMGSLLLALAVDSSSAAMAQGNAEPDRTHVFVDGALTVPGAPKDVDTVPSKYSSRNDASDRLPIVAFRLKRLTDDQRREIYEQLTGGPPPLALSPGQNDPHATIGAEIPASLALRDFTPVPDALAARLPELRGTVFMQSDGRVLLIDPANSIVIGVLPG
jgi:hypothetical protein